jgi:hypothetical protein
MWGNIALSFNSQTIEGINRDARKVDQFQTCDGEKIRFRQDQ